LRPPEPVYVRLEAPPGIGAVQTLSGKRMTIGEDRIVEMSVEDAKLLDPRRLGDSNFRSRRRKNRSDGIDQGTFPRCGGVKGQRLGHAAGTS
jgi:hypothetical protein